MKQFGIELKWAFIFIAVSLIWMYVEKLAGLHGEHIDKHPTYTWLFAILAFLMYYYALKEKREKGYQGRMTWTQGFKSGLIITAVIALFSPLTQYITHQFISPEYFDTAIAAGLEKGAGSREDLENQLNLGLYMKIAPLFVCVQGLITSAIIALFTRKS